MVDSIRGPQGPKGLDKARSARKPTGAGSVSFADLLAQAEQADAVSSSEGSFGQSYAAVLPELEEQEKKETFSKQQAQGLLAALQEAAEDILSGGPSMAAGKLKQYLASRVIDEENLSPEQKKALDDLQTRAAVTAAKMDSKV